MRQRITLTRSLVCIMPKRDSLPEQGCRPWIRAKAQMHERRWSPVRPVAGLARGPDDAPQPVRRRRAANGCIIARTGDNSNGHDARNAAPVFPLAELLQIIRAHQPDEAMARVPADERAQRVDRVARAEVRLDRGGADRRVAGLSACTCHARDERCHALCSFERIAGRHQPPDLVQPQRRARS